MSRRFWTEDKIISEIQKLHEQQEDLWYRAMERNHKDLIRASERYFKGWKNAVTAAGLDYNSIKKRSHQVWTEDKILQKLFELSSQHSNLKPSMVQNLDKKLYHATIRQFKNFGNAISQMNDKYNLKPRAETKPKTQKAIKQKIEGLKIFTVKTRIRSERNVGETLVKRANSQGINIGSIQYPAILNGYLFVECESREALNKLIKNVRNAQGLLNGETTQEEISGYLSSRKMKRHLIEGTNVEITDGQFKGERAIIQRVNNRTKELTVELLDEVLKIPITISKNQCKIVN
jgi:transcriptional antiterminator NusG